MAFWNDRRGIDDLVATGDRTLNVLVIVLLGAFALGSGAYYYGQMNPRVPSSPTSQTAPSTSSPASR